MFAIFYGCGVKSNPVLLKSGSERARMIQNLTAAIEDNAVVLQWDFRARNLKNGYIAVERSEAGSTGNECPDCPRTFESIAKIPVGDVKKEDKGYNSYVDKETVKGKTYRYRLLFCDGFNNCSVNAVTEINFE
jgi:hypothetical protein